MSKAVDQGGTPDQFPLTHRCKPRGDQLRRPQHGLQRRIRIKGLIGPEPSRGKRLNGTGQHVAGDAEHVAGVRRKEGGVQLRQPRDKGAATIAGLFR